MWVVIALRIPAARRSPQQRMLLLAVAGMAGSITVYLAPVLSALNALPGIVVQGCGLFTNVWGVFSSALVLDFVLGALGKRRARLVYGVTAGVIAALIVLNVTIFPNDEGCVTTNHAAWYSTFWWLLIASHLVAKIPCVILCARYSYRASEDRSLRIGLGLFAAAFAVSTFFWLTMLYVLLFDARWIGKYSSLMIGTTAVLMAAGAALPLVLDTARMVRDMISLWRLWPLWRDLVADVPHVALTEPGPRVRDLIGTPRSTYLRLYRRVIEIRDAMLILRDYVTPETIERARSQVTGGSAAVTATWLEIARQAKRAGAEPVPNPLTFTELTGDDLAAEIRYLLAVAEARAEALSAEGTSAERPSFRQT
ncbi:MAB_1171c family putative transporter [Lentzea sp. NBRC 105346]|uniref:MAB_1171c family putative transporter n=1 Tax=Lentzea sp. NBRC 105346 TaxID=3032205 RepID=UPI00332F1AE8